MTRENQYCKWFYVCSIKRYFEEGKLDEKWIKTYCDGGWANCVRYEMEEKGNPHPDRMLPDGGLDKNLKD